MPRKTPDSLVKFTRLVSRDRGLAGLLEHARGLGELRDRLAGSLPRELSEGWQLARLDREQLVVAVDSPARATRFRYSQAALLHAAQSTAGIRPKAVKIKVVPPVRQAKSRPPRQLSAQVGELLTSAAGSVDDARLRQALLRLAGRARRDGAPG